MRLIKMSFILSLIAAACAACGVRGPLTVSPAPVKGISPDAPASAADLRANPASHVLYSADGKKTAIPNPEAK